MSLTRHSFEQVKVVSMQMSYRWDINEPICFKCAKPGYKIVSPIFSLNDLQWRLVLCPNGNVKENEDYLTIYLYSNNSMIVKILFSISIPITSANNIHTKSSKDYLTFSPSSLRGFTRFFRNDSVPSKFSITCEIKIDEASLNENKTYKLQATISESEEMEEVCKVDSFENLLNNKKYSDFKFIIDDKELYVHKSILACRSGHFERMFEHETRTEDTIKDVKYEVFYELLRFLYTGKISDIDKHAQDLLIVADRYDVNELKIACEKLIFKNLTIDNAIYIIKFADMHNAVQLKSEAINFIGYHGEEIIKLPEFKSSIKDLNEDLNHEIICSCVRSVRCHKC